MNKDFQIIPAIDIIGGKCVRLIEGDYKRQTTYDQDPLAMAKQFEAAGLRRLHLVDLDGAKSGSVKNWKTLEQIASQTTLVVDFGGGIQLKEDVIKAFNAGASFCTIGSMAIKNEPELLQWFKEFGAHKFLLGADTKDEKIMVRGWQEATLVSILDFIENFMQKGVKEIFCTDVRRDGRLQGPGIDLYKKILERFPELDLIASGGVSSMKDIEQVKAVGCKAVIVGKAIYENKIRLKEFSNLI
jgi:phosphoribosylformimino-5-aminoimidazole carboxamide ribotide isomerase